MMKMIPVLLAVAACTSNMPGGDDDEGGPTKLPVDCRKKDTTDMRCQSSSVIAAHTFGKGPNDDFYAYGGGFVDAANNRLVVAFACDFCQKGDTGVMAIDLTTGDRTLLSGAIKDTLTGDQSVGNGDTFTSIDDVQVAPNGKWWVLDSIRGGAMIHEVDPATGDRTVLYTQAQLTDRETGICRQHGVVVEAGMDGLGESFSSGLANMIIHPDGKIYLRGERGGDDALPEPNEIDVSAIVELDHGTCRVVTSYSPKDPAYNLGSGPGIDDIYGWLAERKGQLVSNANRYYLHAIDIATGNRTMLSSANPSELLGTGGKFGGATNTIAPDGSTILATGNFDTEVYGGITSINGDTGDRTAIVPVGPQRNADEANVIAHPSIDGVYLMPGLGMVTLFEPATTNSIYLSR